MCESRAKPVKYSLSSAHIYHNFLNYNLWEMLKVCEKGWLGCKCLEDTVSVWGPDQREEIVQMRTSNASRSTVELQSECQPSGISSKNHWLIQDLRSSDALPINSIIRQAERNAIKPQQNINDCNSQCSGQHTAQPKTIQTPEIILDFCTSENSKIK